MLVTLLPGTASAESGVGTIVDHYLEGGYGVVVEAKFQAVPDSPTSSRGIAWECSATTILVPGFVAATTALPECSVDGVNVPVAAPGHQATANGLLIPAPDGSVLLCVQASVTDTNDNSYLTPKRCDPIKVTI